MQITELVYAAKVYDSAGTEISANNEWVSAVKFPFVPCRCDFNGSGALSIQDLFDFLTAYFGNCNGYHDPDVSCLASGDFNNSGGISVQDIFDFLTCYFAGCSSGWDNSGGDLRFTYTSDGLVRTRTSIEGGTFTYAYDTLSRLTNIGVTGTAYEGAAVPVDSIRQVSFDYDALSRLTGATAAADAGTTTPDPYTVASNLFQYDGLGNLLKEYVAHGATATTSSPVVEYGWSTPTSTTPFTRLTSMKLPIERPISGGTARRQIDFDYGQADTSHTEDNLLGRVRDVRDAFNTQNTTLARFSYVGESRRAGVDRGVTLNGSGVVTAVAVSQSFGVGSPTPVMSGLDRFGQIKDLKYVGLDPSNATATLFEGQYIYDTLGNRLCDRLTYQADTSAGTDGLDRSWKYTYDALDRLVIANAGRLNSSNGFETTTTSGPINRYRQTWGLDDLGNFGFASYGGQLDGRLTSKWWGLSKPVKQDLSCRDTKTRTSRSQSHGEKSFGPSPNRRWRWLGVAHRGASTHYWREPGTEQSFFDQMLQSENIEAIAWLSGATRLLLAVWAE